MARRWDENADQWTRDVRAGHDLYREHFSFPAFLEVLPSIGGLDVIDFDCGEGTNTRAFARLGARMSGIDLSPRMIGHARRMEEAVPRFPRTLSDYLNAVIASGFTLAAILEPTPSDEACRRVPRFARWRDLGAFLLLVRARKA